MFGGGSSVKSGKTSDSKARRKLMWLIYSAISEIDATAAFRTRQRLVSSKVVRVRYELSRGP